MGKKSINISPWGVQTDDEYSSINQINLMVMVVLMEFIELL